MDKQQIANIEKKQKHLEWVNKKLKEHFVGIDNIIDDITDSIEAWYAMPGLQMRPTVICLWGMTGVGKTDLVNRLVTLLGCDDQFLKIELGDKSNHFRSILAQLKDQSNITNGSSGILLFDEIQKFRTIDEDKKEKADTGYCDFWEMLSDGRIDQRHIIKEIIDTLSAKIHQDEKKKAAQSKNQSTNKKKKTLAASLLGDDDEDLKIYGYEAERIIYYLGLSDMHRSDITGIGEKELIDLCKELLISPNKHFFDMSKTLIFISGNLDEAYSFSKSVANADTHADLYHELSKKISFLDIKKALLKRFRAEQIARLGNFHLVYPSLSSFSYKEIIKRRLVMVSQNVLEKHDINVDFDSSVYNYIYDNGVFPTQGTRPVFSTIQMVIENNLPKILLNCFKKGATGTKLFFENGRIIARLYNSDVNFVEEIQIPHIGQIDSIKKKQTLDQLALTSVHEAGHAIVVAAKFGVAPPQINVSTSNDETEGFICMPSAESSKKNLKNKIVCLMAGKAAETLYFGKDYGNAGCSSDITKATEIACNMVNRWGMVGNKQRTPYRSGCQNFNERSEYLADDIESQEEVRFIIHNSYKEANTIITQNTPLFQDIVDTLIRDTLISPEDFVKICEKHDIIIRVMKEGEELTNNYADIVREIHEG